MSATEKTTHEAEALATLIGQFHEKPLLAALIDSYTAQIQEIEGVLFDILASYDIATAVETQLDLLGLIVGQARNNLSDSDYRLWIYARILVNKASGKPNEILNILETILPSQGRTLTEYYPASFIVEFAEALTVDLAAVVEILAGAKAAAVNGQLIYALFPDTDNFTMSSDATHQVDVNRGFGDPSGQTNLLAQNQRDGTEDGTTTGFTAGGGALGGSSTELPHSGSRSLKMATAPTGGFFETDQIPADALTDYVVSVWASFPIDTTFPPNTGAFTLEIITDIGSVDTQSFPGNFGEYQRLTLTGQTQVGATWIKMRVTSDTDFDSDTQYFDDWQIELGTVATDWVDPGVIESTQGGRFVGVVPLEA